MDIQKLNECIENKLVSVQKHPNADLFIYNYTPLVQYGKIWNDITLNTRGLILDSEMNIKSKPFAKFFNLEEISNNNIPNLPFEVYEKMDGSLGILYWLNNIPYIATRGSFTSEQAKHATNILHTKYSHIFDKIDKESTYLFEIIYPENRIVVDYGTTDDLILLTVINNKTDIERAEDIGFPIVQKYDGINDLDKLKLLNDNNKEGFVIRFSNGFRLKVKFSEYVRLHRIITGVSNVTVWEYLSQGKSFEELLDKVPDEFYDWLEHIKNDLVTKFNKILIDSNESFKVFDTRKETALYIKTQKYPSVLFAMLDKKDASSIIWSMIKPKHSKAFKI